MNIIIFNAATGEEAERPLTAEEIAGIAASAPEPLPIPEPVTVVYAVDLWSRMTNAEADQVGAEMEAQPFRIRKIFETANSYRADHELWALLQQIATTLFGAERAAEILAPSV